jgi:hypothetical protein
LFIGLGGRSAWLCDGRARDLEGIEVVGGCVRVPLTGAITSLRLELDSQR